MDDRMERKVYESQSPAIRHEPESTMYWPFSSP